MNFSPFLVLVTKCTLLTKGINRLSIKSNSREKEDQWTFWRFSKICRTILYHPSLERDGTSKVKIFHHQFSAPKLIPRPCFGKMFDQFFPKIFKAHPLGKLVISHSPVLLSHKSEHRSPWYKQQVYHFQRSEKSPASRMSTLSRESSE